MAPIALNRLEVLADLRLLGWAASGTRGARIAERFKRFCALLVAGVTKVGVRGENGLAAAVHECGTAARIKEFEMRILFIFSPCRRYSQIQRSFGGSYFRRRRCPTQLLSASWK